MKYLDKLSTTSCLGLLAGFDGVIMNSPIAIGAGLGLIASAIYGTYNNEDEFEELREEVKRRERLYSKK